MRISDWSSDVCSSDLDLKVIVTSATIDTERFAAHFGGAPVVDVEGSGHPVEVRYRPLEGEGEDKGERQVLDGVPAACDDIARERQTGRASCRERGCQYVKISVVTVHIKQNKEK